MKCAVHPEVDATGYCRNCGKALCGVCVRPVHDVFYCEDCLATVLGHAAPAAAAPQAAAFAPTTASAPAAHASSASSPGVAFILGLLPGLGAVYNGEYNKALIHVVVFVTLIIGASSDIDTSLMVILILFSIGFCFYMALDAMRVARAKNLGEAPPDALESWSKNRPVGPIILIVLGAIFLLHNFDWFPFYRLARFWPLILIIAGGLMFRNRLSGRS